MNIYLISGLGADERAFSRLILPKEWNRVYLGWPGFSVEDTVESYAKKFLPLIDTNSEFALVGLSFGGMIATEIAKILNPEKTILISSVSSAGELPNYMTLGSKLKADQLLPKWLFKKTPPFGEWLLGISTEEEKTLLHDFITHTSPDFLKWAIHAIVNWKNTVRPKSIYHIHGDNDRIFDYRKVQANHIVKHGGHFMIYNKPEIISELIVKALH